MTSIDEVKKWIKNFESQTIDFKSHGILSHPEDLADLMVAFASNKYVSTPFGGKIIIGVDDNGIVENFIVKQGHEEFIMNVARDKCYPPIIPEFEKIDVDGTFVYVVTIPKMTHIPYQLITKNGKTHKIRVGSTVREPSGDELAKLYANTIPNHNELFSNIEFGLIQINGPFKLFTVIPIDCDSQIFTFDEEITNWCKSNKPKGIAAYSTKLIQNELHYEHELGLHVS